MKNKRILLILSSFLMASCGSAPLSSNSGYPSSSSNTTEDSSTLIYYALDENGGEETRDEANNKSYPIEYIFSSSNQDNLLKPANDPIRRKGVRGNSLYMDGFSNAIINQNFLTPKDAITFSAWVAPRGFENLPNYGDGTPGAGHPRLTSLFSKGDIELGEGFVFGYGRLGLWGMQLALHSSLTGEDFVVGFYDPLNTIPLYEWSYLSATFDGKTGYVCLSFNGEVAYESILEELKGSSLISSGYPLFMGKYVNPTVEMGFERQYPAGLVDEMKIIGSSWTPKQMKEEYLSYCENGVHPELSFDNVKEDRAVYEGDRYRPIYHALPPAVWMNEPHSPFYYKGRYHIFYQHNPIGPYWSQIRWGHLVSDDMVHWEGVKDAVAPTKGICPEGVWTGGSVIGPDGTPWLAITAGTNQSTWSGQNIAFAHPKDPNDSNLEEWIVESTCVITQPNDDSQGERDQFRDPFIWEDDGTYYMLISTSIPGRGGSANAYTSKNMREWEYRGYVYECDYNLYPEQGAHWECVNLLPISTKDNKKTKWILFDCPQYTVDGYIVDCYYWIGEFDKVSCRFIADDPKPRLFDYGKGIYTGQTGFTFRTEEDLQKGKMRYEEGRTILFSLAQGKAAGSGHNKNSGWAHNMAIPLELYLSDDHKDVLREPIAELNSAEGNTLLDVQSSFNETEINEKLASIQGDSLRIDFDFTYSLPQEDSLLSFQVRYNPYIKDGVTEHTDIRFNRSGMLIDRLSSSTMNVDKADSWIYGAKEGSHHLTVLLDRSMVEAHLDSLGSFTTRIYPKFGDSNGLHFFTQNASLNVTSMRVIEMNSVYFEKTTPSYYGNSSFLADGGTLQ